MGDRPANEDNSVRTLGSLVTDLALSYRLPHIEMYFRVENILNIEWNEAQFDTESRLRGPDENGKFMGTLETESISELNYTPGSPRFFAVVWSFIYNLVIYPMFGIIVSLFIGSGPDYAAHTRWVPYGIFF